MIDKGLYQAPEGLESLTTEPEVEIEIVNPEGVKIDADGLEIEIVPGNESPEDFDANLAEFMEAGELDSVGSEFS